MLPTPRFSFDSPTDGAAKLLLDNACLLDVQLSRETRTHAPMLVFKLEGGFTQQDGDLLAIAKQLLCAFAALPQIGADDGDADN